MIETRDAKLRIYRHEYNTVSLPDAEKEIRWVAHEIAENRYMVEVNGSPVEIQIHPTRVILFGTNRHAMLEVAKLIKYQTWEYDDSKRTDYLGGKQ